jgi:hypothetical protein
MIWLTAALLDGMRGINAPRSISESEHVIKDTASEKTSLLVAGH